MLVANEFKIKRTLTLAELYSIIGQKITEMDPPLRLAEPMMKKKVRDGLYLLTKSNIIVRTDNQTYQKIKAD